MAAKNTAKLTARFQIAIPEAVRTAQGWEPGQVFVFVPKGRSMLLVPVPEFEELVGVARGANTDGYRDRSSRT